MGLFYSKTTKKETTIIQFTKIFIGFNYGVYFFILLFVIVSFFDRILGVVFGAVALLCMLVRSMLLLQLGYSNKTYLKEGSMFSFKRPLSIKIYKT